MNGYETICRVIWQYILIASNMLYSFYRYCLVNSLQCQRMRWLDLRPSGESLYSIFWLRQTCCTGLYNIFNITFIDVVNISKYPWMRWQHLTPSVESAHSMFWSHKKLYQIFTKCSILGLPRKPYTSMTRGPIITTCQKNNGTSGKLSSNDPNHFRETIWFSPLRRNHTRVYVSQEMIRFFSMIRMLRHWISYSSYHGRMLNGDLLSL